MDVCSKKVIKQKSWSSPSSHQRLAQEFRCSQLIAGGESDSKINITRCIQIFRCSETFTSNTIYSDQHHITYIPNLPPSVLNLMVSHRLMWTNRKWQAGTNCQISNQKILHDSDCQFQMTPPIKVFSSAIFIMRWSH